jgi:hypothetical protein
LISSSIDDFYFTQLIGDPNNVPRIKATAGFAGFGLIDGDHYDTSNLRWGSTNVFFRQVRNFILDTTNIPPGSAATGMHWPTSQATSIQNVVFQMSAAAGTQHVGLFCESGTYFLLELYSLITIERVVSETKFRFLIRWCITVNHQRLITYFRLCRVLDRSNFQRWHDRCSSRQPAIHHAQLSIQQLCDCNCPTVVLGLGLPGHQHKQLPKRYRHFSGRISSPECWLRNYH